LPEYQVFSYRKGKLSLESAAVVFYLFRIQQNLLFFTYLWQNDYFVRQPYPSTMLNKAQKEFLVGELNRFTTFHNIRADQTDETFAIEELSDFSLRRKKAILLEAITWCVVFMVNIFVLLYRKRPLNIAASVTFFVLTLGSFTLLLRAMYALGRNRKFRLIVKMLKLNEESKEQVD
jgi:hypothetical protein